MAGDSETSQYMAISAAIVGRQGSGRHDAEPPDERLDRPVERSVRPDLRSFELEGKAFDLPMAIEASKGCIGSNNPKMMAEQANLASVRKQVGDATERMRQHLKERIATTQDQIAAL